MIKNNQKNAILNDFLFFLNSVQEDKPIPRETKFVYFIVDFSNNDIILSYSADEKLFSIFDYGFYCPSDAQHFWSQQLSILSIQLFDKKIITKNEVFDLLKKITLSAKVKCDFLKNYKAYFGERFTKIV